MACLIFGAIHHTIKGVQSGIQAHKDFKSPVHVIDSSNPFDPNSRAPVDKYGHAKEHHPVYGWVMKAEHKFNKGKGRATIIEREEKGMNKEEYEKQNYEAPRGAPPFAPPTYEVATTGPLTTRSDLKPGSTAEYIQGTSPADDKRSNDLSQTVQPRSFETEHQCSSSSASSDSYPSDSERTTGAPSSCKMRKQERRVRRAERKLHRATVKAERKGDRGKLQRAEERLVNAQRKLAATKASASC